MTSLSNILNKQPNLIEFLNIHDCEEILCLNKEVKEAMLNAMKQQATFRLGKTSRVLQDAVPPEFASRFALVTQPERIKNSSNTKNLKLNSFGIQLQLLEFYLSCSSLNEEGKQGVASILELLNSNDTLLLNADGTPNIKQTLLLEVKNIYQNCPEEIVNILNNLIDSKYGSNFSIKVLAQLVRLTTDGDFESIASILKKEMKKNFNQVKNEIVKASRYDPVLFLSFLSHLKNAACSTAEKVTLILAQIDICLISNLTDRIPRLFNQLNELVGDNDLIDLMKLEFFYSTTNTTPEHSRFRFYARELVNSIQNPIIKKIALMFNAKYELRNGLLSNAWQYMTSALALNNFEKHEIINEIDSITQKINNTLGLDISLESPSINAGIHMLCNEYDEAKNFIQEFQLIWGEKIPSNTLKEYVQLTPNPFLLNLELQVSQLFARRSTNSGNQLSNPLGMSDNMYMGSLVASWLLHGGIAYTLYSHFSS